jgi:hypothetical protein
MNIIKHKFSLNHFTSHHFRVANDGQALTLNVDIIDWTLIALPVFAVIVTAVVLALIVYLKKLTKHDLHKSKDGFVYTIIDL